MPLNFTPVSIQKAAKRTFTVPITSAAAFDANVAALKSADNPLGAIAGGVTVSEETYKATVAYLNPLGKITGTIVVSAPTRSAYDAIVADILADSTLTASFGEGAVADRDNTKDSWNARLKIQDPTGETYYLSFTRKDLRISSYENDDILTKVDAWADGVTSLN